MQNRLKSGDRRMSRRDFLEAAVATGALSAINTGIPGAALAGTEKTVSLKAAPNRVRLVPEPYNDTLAWCYNQTVPGPEIRVRQGDRIRVEFENELNEETTIHWHGVRLPNAMDGVAHLTQIPVAPNSTFVYEFDAIDAGTFWYHPHQRGFEQVGRGLYGSLIVEEHNPIQIDRELTWILDDWRLEKSAEISNDFGDSHDMSHNGRVGNTVTINGKVPESMAARSGERIRLRLINAANARIFELEFADHNPIVIGPAMRVDIILDMIGDPNSKSTVTDVFYRDMAYRLVDIEYEEVAVREETPDWSMELDSNPLQDPDQDQATRHEIQFSGGMMGNMAMRQMGITPKAGMGSMMNMMHNNKMWFINGVAAEGHIMDPVLTLKREQSYIIELTNATAWHHPIHLHGHSFRVLSRNGVKTPHQEWQDTVLMDPRERVEIAFVADNPGDWMFHCHILEHMLGGMMAVIRVT